MDKIKQKLEYKDGFNYSKSVHGFLDMIRENYANVDGFVVDEGKHKDSFGNFISNVLMDFLDLDKEEIVQEKTEIDDLGSFANAGVLLSQRFASGLDNLSSNSEYLDKDVANRDIAMFTYATSKLFPQLKQPSTIEDAQVMMQTIADGIGDTELATASLVNGGLYDIANTDDVSSKIDKIDQQLMSIGNSLYNYGNFGQIEESIQSFGVVEGKQSGVINSMRVMRKLILVRKTLMDSIKNNSDTDSGLGKKAELKATLNKEVNFFKNRLNYPFSYTSVFDRLPDDEYTNFAEEVSKLGISLRREKVGEYSKQEYIDKLNAILAKYKSAII